jgi:hypothetical protein
MKQINPYNPLDLEALGSSLVRELERRPHDLLGNIKSFTGSGIYALYYVGHSYPYAEMGAFNRMHHCRLSVPIEDCTEAPIEIAHSGPLLSACRWALSCRILASCPLGRRPMYRRETLVLLKHFLEAGQSKTAMARELGISRRLVYHWIATGQLERDRSGEASRVSRHLKFPTSVE